MAEFLRINLGSSFLLNAGILGLVNTLEYMQAKLGDDIDDDCDYIIDGQTLMLSEEFLLSHDMGEIYVKSIVEHLREYTNLHRILSKQDYLKSLIQKYTEADEKSKKPIEKDINAIYSEFAKKLESPSFLSGYVIVQEDEIPILIKNLKTEKDLMIKCEIYKQIYDIVSTKEVSEVLYFKDLMYTKLNMFLSGTSLFFNNNNKNTNITDVYFEYFSIYLINYIIEKHKTPKRKQSLKRCIECGELIKSLSAKNDKQISAIYNKKNNKTKKKEPIQTTSFMVDTTDDVARKKSYYWNCKPDAYLCPICAFVYTFVPLGFAFLGQDAVFVNNNSDIKVMRDLMSTYKTQSTEKLQNEKKLPIARLYKPFTQIKADMLKNKLSNIQVIVKRRDNDHYGMNIIDNKIIANFNKSAKDLKQLEDKTIKIGDKYVKFYDEVFDNILFRRNQYNLIDKLLRYHLNKGDENGYIKNILQIQIIFWGGSNVDNMLKTANTAWKVGMKMRNSFSDVGEKDKDNKLRGFVYQLSNALTVGNREHFLDLVIRIYASKGVPIPYIFKNCFESDDMFKTIGYGYVLGLKANNDKEEQKNEE